MNTVMKQRLGATLVAIALTAGGLGVAGCGGDSPSASSSVSSAATADNGVASLTGSEILTKSFDAATAATSVTVTGSVPQGSDTITIELALGDGVATGTIGIKGVTVKILRVDGKFYLNAPKALFDQIGTGGGAVGTLLANKWFTVPTTGAAASSFKGFDNIANMDALFNGLLKNGTTNPKVEGTGEVNGQPAVLLSGSHNGTLAVATTGEPYPLQVKQTAAGQDGVVNFSKWNEPVTATAPADALDFGALAGGGSSSTGSTTSSN